MRKREILEELESHVAELIDEYVQSGLSRDDARTRALNTFGDIALCAEETAMTHAGSRMQQLFFRTVVTVSALLCATIIIAALAFAGTSLGADLAPIALNTAYAIITVLCLWFVYQVITFYGVIHTRVIWYAMAYTLCADVTITTALDIDKFEGILHSLVIMIAACGLLKILWKHISFFVRTLYLIIVSAIVLVAGLYEYRLLDFIGKMRCLFITPDNIPLEGALKTCSQVQFWSHILWPIYIALGISIVLVIIHAHRVIHSAHIGLRHKIFLIAFALSWFFIPIFFHDLNNTGELDVLPWEKEIYSAYHDVLGRNPQEKDIVFYAVTRAYEHMDRVRDVLYASEERKIKIDLIFQEVYGRHAAEQEINTHVNARTSIEHIYSLLRNQ